MIFFGQKKGSRGGWHSRGFVLLLVLVAIAILAILYVMQMETFFGPVAPSGQSTAKHKPWLEEGRIVPSDKLIKLPRPPRLELNKPLTVTARVRLNESERGTVILDFTVVGEVAGTWYCEYSHDNRNYMFDAAFAGNVDVTKTYSKGKNPDESKLYFITKGNYTQTVYNVETGSETTEQGLVYVTGWLSPDHSAEGLITITTDKTWSAAYAWQTGQ
jgi:type II secretory pathway pseudopilin PulG